MYCCRGLSFFNPGHSVLLKIWKSAFGSGGPALRSRQLKWEGPASWLWWIVSPLLRSVNRFGGFGLFVISDKGRFFPGEFRGLLSSINFLDTEERGVGGCSVCLCGILFVLLRLLVTVRQFSSAGLPEMLFVADAGVFVDFAGVRNGSLFRFCVGRLPTGMDEVAGRTWNH